MVSKGHSETFQRFYGLIVVSARVSELLQGGFGYLYHVVGATMEEATRSHDGIVTLL